MDLRRGACFVGTEVVKDFGGGSGTAFNCFTSGALRTQKWIVVLGTAGLREPPITPKDHPAFHNARRRDSISERVRVDRWITSSMGSLGGLSMILLYRVLKGVYEKKGDSILYDSFKYMNLSIICFWPRRRQKRFFALFKIVPGFFSKKSLYFLPPFFKLLFVFENFKISGDEKA
jgi:hypothetical protein